MNIKNLNSEQIDLVQSFFGIIFKLTINKAK